MNKSLDHLPESKKEEIIHIAEIIREVTNPEKIILFGSYAKGTFKDSRYVSDGIAYEYVSDYDFLVVTLNNKEKTYVQEGKIMDRTDRYRPPVNLEIHEIDYINKGLEIGEYFFVDIVKEGILLYDAGGTQFVEPRELSAEEKKAKAQRYFDIWFPQVGKFLKTSRFNFGEKDYKLGAFILHQATESLYYAVLLVFTEYKPKTHNLWKLRKKAKPFSEELFSVFRTEVDKQENHLFDLLKRGYIDARYRIDYNISPEELTILIDRIAKMEPIAERLCLEKIDSF